jgi:hypothetical protein
MVALVVILYFPQLPLMVEVVVDRVMLMELMVVLVEVGVVSQMHVVQELVRREMMGVVVQLGLDS